MAPEQIEGKPADERTDIFAFGLVAVRDADRAARLRGESAAGVIAAILEREPTPISALQPATPPALEQVVLTCLAKDPAERWQSVREMKHALEWAARTGWRPTGGGGPWKGVAVGAVALLAVAIGFAIVLRSPTPSKAPPRPARGRSAREGRARPAGSVGRLARR